MTPHRTTRRNTATIVVALGGHGGRVFPYLADLYDDHVYTLVIDCSEELKRLGNAIDAPRVQAFALGVNESAQTLCAEAPAELLEHLQNLGGMDASAGAGQAMAVAHHATMRFIRSPGFKNFCRKTLVPAIRTATGGAPEAIRVVLLGSDAGAMFSAGQKNVADGLARELLTHTSASVTTYALSTGGLTYEGLGDNIWKNAASSMLAQVEHCTSPNRHPREIRKLRLIEFDVLGQDEALRDAFLAQVEQAALSAHVQLDQRRRGPNDSLTGPFGNIQTWEAAFGHALEIAADIVPVAHSAYGEPLREILERNATVAALERIEVDEQLTELNNESVETIVASAVDHSAKWAIDKLMSPTYRVVKILNGRIGPNNLVNLAHLDRLWAEFPNSLDEMDQRLQFQRRLLELLDPLPKELAELQEETEEALTAATSAFEKHHQRLVPSGLIQGALALLSSTSSKFSKLTRSATEIRELADELVLTKALAKAVENRRSYVQKSHDYLANKIRSVLAGLDEIGPSLGSQPAMVEMLPLDGRLADLFGLIDDGTVAFADWLRRSVQYATISGLASVCGASAPEIEEIARQIVYGRAYSTPAIPWGGRRRSDRGHCVHVLPPLEPRIANLITSAVHSLNRTINIAIANKAPAVVNVVHLEIRLVRELGDVLTEPYKLGLSEAVNSPCPLMFFENIESLRRFGIYDFVTSSERKEKPCYFSFVV